MATSADRPSQLQVYNPSSNLFTDPNGRSFRIYVEPTEVQERAVLIRYLKSAGATLVHSPSDAQIVLVAREGESGGELVEAWGEPPHRVVLDVHWAWTALGQNRLSLWSESWGGFRLTPSGTDVNEVVHHPLPTPRQTPFDSARDHDLQGKSALQEFPQAPTIRQTTSMEGTESQTIVPTHLFRYLVGVVEQGIQSGQLSPSLPLPQILEAAHQEKSSDTPQVHIPTQPTSPGEAVRGVPPSRPHKTTHPGTIFMSRSGEPLGVYVQMSIPDRWSLVEAIKNNGGRIVPNISHANYAILNPRDKSNYAESLQTCAIHDKPALKADFIRACVGRHELLETEDFLLEEVPVTVPYSGRGRRPKPIAVNRREANKYEPTAKRNKIASPKSLERVPSASQAKLTPNATRSLDRRPTSRSPSPAPPKTLKDPVGKKRFYTAEERDFMLRYLPKLFLRDPDASHVLISKKLYEKIPRHSSSSWYGELRRQEKQVEKIRKKIAIQLRKPTTANQSVANQPVASASTSNALQAPGAHEAFEDIVTWFLTGKADTLSDEQVWPALASMHTYMSAVQWRAFWVSNDSLVVQTVSSRRNQTGQGPVKYEPM